MDFFFFRKDRYKHGGGLILYINEDIACKAVNIDTMSTEYIEIELIFKNIKWLLIGLYANDKSFISNLNITLSKTAETYNVLYSLVILIWQQHTLY